MSIQEGIEQLESVIRFNMKEIDKLKMKVSRLEENNKKKFINMDNKNLG